MKKCVLQKNRFNFKKTRKLSLFLNNRSLALAMLREYKQIEVNKGNKSQKNQRKQKHKQKKIKAFLPN